MISRIRIRNYKSIAACDVALSQLTFLVGANGSGKSNFLDALRFIADSLRTSLDHALRDRGGIQEVRRRSGGHPNHFGIRVDFTLPNGSTGHFAFRIGAKQSGAFSVQDEECVIRPASGLLELGAQPSHYRIKDGTIRSATFERPPVGSNDRLYLVTLSGLPAFRPLYDALSSMGFYNLAPAAIRDLQPPNPGELLHRDGSNLPSVLANLERHEPLTKKRIEEFLAAVVPGIGGVHTKAVGHRETLEFRQGAEGARTSWRFIAANMSDGTLRALGVLVALFQSGAPTGAMTRVVGIEEPETALHPAASAVLVDALREASRFRQVLVTSHSPELLNSSRISPNELLAVVAEDGVTKIGPLDQAGRSALSDHLYTAGELLRMDQLMPDPSSNVTADQLVLFSPDS